MYIPVEPCIYSSTSVTIYNPKQQIQIKMFTQLKRTHQTASDSTESTEIANKKARVSTDTPVEKKNQNKMMFFKDWNAGSFVPEVEDDYTGEKTVSLKDGKYNAMVTTAPLTIKYSEMGPKGNLGTKFVSETAFSSAKFTMTLEKGVDSKVLAAMPTVESEQDAYFKWMNATGTSMLTLAWEKELPMFNAQRKKCMAAAKREAKKDKELDVNARALELFLKDASLPVTEKLDDDGDGTLINKIGRRYQYTSKQTGEIVINRPRIWKRKREGGYEDITDDIKYLPKGSVVITQVSFRCYSMASYYGISTDMGKHVILVWRKPTSGVSKDSNPTVPYFE